jgi:flagellar biosynthesis GTPase FlhF
MAEETTQAGGVTNPESVNESGTVTASAPQLQTQATTQTTAEQQAPKRNLDDDPDFRAFKSSMQRQVQQALTLAEQQKQEANRLRQEAESARLATADPDERAAYFEKQLQAERAQYQQAQQQQAKEAQYRDRAYQRVVKAGIDPNDTRLRFEGASVEERYANLLESVTEILAEDRQKADADAKKQVKKEVVNALNEAGVTKTSTASAGAALPADEQEKRDLQAQWKKIKGSGNTRAYAQLRSKANRLGIDLN